MKKKVTLLAFAAIGLSACAIPQPTGPSIVALP
ncbi:MAG: hypothetical protein JWR10_1638, partial [Rubritepida sp.]|nr:hypothetical protein [Rubritepida sp.]